MSRKKAKGKARAAAKAARAAAAAAEAAAWAAAAEAARAAPPPPPRPRPPPRPFPRRSAPASGTGRTATSSSSTVVAYGLLAAAALFLAGVIFFLAKTLFFSLAAAAAGPPSFLPLPARALLSWPFRLPWLVFRTLVFRPRWWVAALEVLLMGSFYSRSVSAAVLLTHPVAWALAPGVPGLAGSLATFLVAVVVLVRGDAESDAARDAALARGDAAAAAAAMAEATAAKLGAICAVATATPVAWGLAAAAVRVSLSWSSSPALFAGPAVAAIAWGWWRVVSQSTSSARQSDRNERRQRQQQFPMRRLRTDHLPGKAPRGATGDVARVLSSRDFVEVLGLHGGGGGGGGGRVINSSDTNARLSGSNSGSSCQSSLAASLRSLDDAEVKAAWRRLVKSVHPDRHSGGGGGGAVGAEEAFSLVTEAFESLRDAGARARYARSLGLALS